MSSLISLSMDHMTLVAAYLPGYDIARLWCTGNRRVQRLLIDIDALYLTHMGRRPIAWPKRLVSSLLCLRSLHISTEIGFPLKQLPDSLWDTPLTSILHVNLDVFSRQPLIRNVASYFPRLISFKAIANDLFDINDLLPLPDTLKVLVISKPVAGKFSFGPSRRWPSLPMELKHLECTVQPFFMDANHGGAPREPVQFNHYFPPRLHTLALAVIETPFWKLLFVDRLPTSLTSVTIDILSRNANFPAIDDEYYSSICRQLPQLQHFGDTSNDYHPIRRVHAQFNPATLPESLTSLDFTYLDISPAELVSNMPRSLHQTLKHVLISGKPLVYYSNDPDYVPVNIQNLEVLSPMSMKDWKVFPPSVTSLILHRTSLPKSKTVYLPSKLRSLVLRGDLPVSAPLSPSLTFLLLRDCHFGTAYSSFPANLTTIIVPVTAFAKKANWRLIRNLPVLGTLLLEQSFFPSSFNILNFPEEVVYLPPSLTAFSAHFDSADWSYHRWLSQLCPRSLHNPLITPKLNSLSLRTHDPPGYVPPYQREADRTGKGVWHFPPQLRLLRVTLLHPTADFFSALPEDLCYLFIIARDATPILPQWLAERKERGLHAEIESMMGIPAPTPSSMNRWAVCLVVTVMAFILLIFMVSLLRNGPSYHYTYDER